MSPVYNFACKKCEEKFEVTLPISKEKIRVRCPKCKSSSNRKIIVTTPTIRFVGGGFYVTDHPKKP